MTTVQTHTARSAMAVARVAYARMAASLLAELDDDRLGRVARRAFQRGYSALLGLEATASDVALSAHAAEALEAHLLAIDSTDVTTAMTWLDLFPDVMLDVRRDSEIAVVELRAAEWLEGLRGRLVESDWSHLGYRPTRARGNRQPALALAA